MTDALLNKMWSQSINHMRGNIIKIKCLSPGTLYIRDLNRTFTYGTEETVTIGEYHSSKELQGAITKNLLIVSKDQNLPNQPIIKNKPIQTIIDQDMLRNMVTEVASELVQQILQQLPISTQPQVVQQIQQIQQVIPQQIEKKLQAVEIEEEHFVRMNSESETETSSNLSSQVDKKSVATEQVLSSLAKLKALKNK